MVEENMNIAKRDIINRIEILFPILNTLFMEIKELSKKKPDGQMNKLKVQMVNKILSQTKSLLSTQPTGQFLEVLDDENLPSYSDALLIISQHRTVVIEFKKY